MPRSAHPGKEIRGGMGQSLINKKRNMAFKRQANTQYAGVHVSDASIDGSAGRYVSVTDRHELDDFLCDALLKDTEFEVQHQSTVILTNEAVVKPKGDHQLFEYETIPIPRRPHWDHTTTAEELDRSEREAFMHWRRGLAQMEENLAEARQLTPFEKNIEVWRQLWRVLERSNIVVQILDARNPLLFRSKDLEAYVKELSEQKTVLLVINKADYLTPRARRSWAEYFRAHSIDFVFWSAALEQARLEKLERARRRKENRDGYHGHNIDKEEDEGKLYHSEDEQEEPEQKKGSKGAKAAKGKAAKAKQTQGRRGDQAEALQASSMWQDEEQSQAEATDAASAAASSSSPPAAAADASSSSSSSSSSRPAPSSSSHRILTRDELFAYIVAKFASHSAENRARVESGERIIIGMAGYPNVGKSSTINVLAGANKVRVGATPGKTKHFQTININEQITLCDSPGLVFPTFLSSRAELVCNGIMPIDQIKDWKNIWAPVQLVCEKISRDQLQLTYSLLFPSHKELGADELLHSYARMRGFFKDHGRPDEAHAARIILKDFCAGKLLYCHPPPDLSFEKRREFYRSFQSAGKCLINEQLWLSEEERAAAAHARLQASVARLGAPAAVPASAVEPVALVGEANVGEDEEAGLSLRRKLPSNAGGKKASSAAAASSASSSSSAPKSAASASAQAADSEQDEEDEDEEGGDSGAEGFDSDVEAVSSRPVRAKIHQGAYDALLRDAMEDLVLPSSHNKDAQRLLEQGLNPDGTPLTKKQLQRLNQRPRRKTGKAFKLRKNDVVQAEVAMKTGGNSASAAARMGVFHG